jgi:hypothetical protein
MALSIDRTAAGWELLLGSFQTAVKLCATLQSDGLPPHVEHLLSELEDVLALESSVREAPAYVIGCAKLYLKLFETLPLFSAEAEPRQRTLLLRAREQLAHVLRSNLVSGMLARARLVDYQRSLLRTSGAGP